MDKKVFWKNILASWYLILFAAAVCMLFAYLIINLVMNTVDERIVIAQKAAYYEVAEGTVESVTVKKYYTEKWAGHSTDLIPDRKYSARISYIDKMGIVHQCISSEVDKKLTEGKRVRIAYHTEDEKDVDIAYFDVFVMTYIPCYLNTFSWKNILAFVLLSMALSSFAYLLCGIIKECAQEDYRADERKKKTSLQWRVGRNIWTILACFSVPVSIFIHISYLTGKKLLILAGVDRLVMEWPDVCRQIAVALVCYFPVLLFWCLRTIYERRRLEAKTGR